MTVWREEDLAALHAGRRLDRRDLIDGGFDHEAYAAQRKLADKAKEFYDKVGEQAIQGLLDDGYSARDVCTATTGPPVGSYQGWSSAPSVEEIKKLLSAGIGVPKMSRAYLVVPPEMEFPEMQFVPFEEEQTKSRMWRHSWGDYNFGMPIVRSPFIGMAGAVDTGLPSDWPVKEEPVLPRLMAEHVELEQPRDLSVWQALIFVVVVGTILCLLGGVL